MYTSKSSLNAVISFLGILNKYANNSENLSSPTTFKLVKKGEIKAMINTKKLEYQKRENEFGTDNDLDGFKDYQKKNEEDLNRYRNKLTRSTISIDTENLFVEEDPELVGLISILEKKKTSEERERFIEKLFSNYGYKIKSNPELMIKAYSTVLENVKTSFAVKLFNSIFGRPENNDIQGMPITRYIPHMDGILKNYIKGVSYNEVVNLILKSEIKSQNLREEVKAAWLNNGEIPKSIGKVEYQVYEKMLNSGKAFYAVLDKYSKNIMNQNNVENFASRIKRLNKIVEEGAINNLDFEQFLIKYVNILRELRNLSVVNEKNQEKTLDKDFTKMIREILPFRLSKVVKNKIEYCITDDVKPVLVEKQFDVIKTDKLKKEKKVEKPRELHEFVIEDFNYRFIDFNVFDKFIETEEQVFKHVRVAHGIKLLHMIIEKMRLIQISNKGSEKITIYVEY